MPARSKRIFPPAEAFAVRPSTIPGAGLGLFARRAFAEDDLLGRYTGEALTIAELAAGRFAGSDYLLAVSATHLIAGEGPRANHTRYINHRESPNALLETSARWRTAWFVATRAIEPGEEIFFDYGEAYWREAGVAAKTTEFAK
jgi:uncharacterized protein